MQVSMTIKHAYDGPDDFGNRLRWARERIGMSAAELGRQSEYKGGTSIYRIEVGDTRAPRTDVTIKMARALGVRVEWLIDGTLPIFDESASEPTTAPTEQYSSLDRFIEEHGVKDPRALAYLRSQNFGDGKPDGSHWLRLLRVWESVEKGKAQDDGPELAKPNSNLIAFNRKKPR